MPTNRNASKNSPSLATPRTVIARIRGGLGNQLFMYAMARRLACANQAELAMDTVTGFQGHNKYGRQYMLNRFPIHGRHASASEMREPFQKLRRSARKWWDAHKPIDQRQFVVDTGSFNPEIYALKINRPTTFEGYWQSEKWFNSMSNEIRQECTPNPPTDAANIQLAETIQSCTSVALHVRFFFDANKTVSNQNVINYYKRAIRKLHDSIENPRFFIFSDQPDQAIQLLSLDKQLTQVVNHNSGDENAHWDLWLMSRCQHFITANSTFSWWGAWLGEKPGSIVIAPIFTAEDAFLAWGLPGLIPERWISL